MLEAKVSSLQTELQFQSNERTNIGFSEPSSTLVVSSEIQTSNNSTPGILGLDSTSYPDLKCQLVKFLEILLYKLKIPHEYSLGSQDQ